MASERCSWAARRACSTAPRSLVKTQTFVLLANPENLARLRAALAELQGKQRYVPGLELDALQRGHGVQFECGVSGAGGIRLDIMSTLRRVDPFSQLWGQRTTFQDHRGNTYDALGLEDLVKAKKTRRPKDRPMVAASARRITS